MAKFKQNNVELRDGQKIIFDSAKNKYMVYDSTNVSINTTLGGIDPTEDDHLTTKKYVDEKEVTPTIIVEDEGVALSNTPNTVLNFVGDAVEATDSTGSEATITINHQDLPVFGTEYGYAASEGESSTTSVTPQEKVSLSKTSLPNGNYRIDYSAEYTKSDDKNSEVMIQVQINDTTTIGSHEDTAIKIKDDFVMISGFYESVLSGDADIDIDYWDPSGTGMSIRRARLSIFRTS